MDSTVYSMPIRILLMHRSIIPLPLMDILGPITPTQHLSITIPILTPSRLRLLLLLSLIFDVMVIKNLGIPGRKTKTSQLDYSISFFAFLFVYVCAFMMIRMNISPSFKKEFSKDKRYFSFDRRCAGFASPRQGPDRPRKP
jgi:hypothetical protein